MKIVDAHCHVASFQHIPRSFVEGVIANLAALLAARNIKRASDKLWEYYEQKMQDPCCDELAQEIRSAGIERSILLVPDFTLALKDCPLTIQESFQAHRDVLARHPGRFEVFGGVDPRWGKDGLDLFERSLAQYGFHGFKVYPPCGFSASDPALFPFYEICAEKHAPVVVHVGPSSPALAFTYTNPFLLDEAARLFPGVNFVLAHGAVSFTEECIMMCRFRPNVYLDLSAYQMTLGFDPETKGLRSLLSRGINHKILFGTDWPIFRLQGNQITFVSTLIAEDGALAELSEIDKALILHRNVERLLDQASCPVPAPQGATDSVAM